VKGLIFLGSSLQDLKDFSPAARHAAGQELRVVQEGLEPSDWKPMSIVGSGVCEIRVYAEGAWRVVYVAKFANAVYVLHCFRKKSFSTSQADIRLARRRYQEIQHHGE
jgi:phage-related protein